MKKCKPARLGETGFRGMGLGMLTISLAFAVVAMLFAASAFGATVTDRPLLFSFSGGGTTAGAFADARQLEVDQTNGDVYVLDGGKKVIDKFNASGIAQNFSATGSSSLAIPIDSALNGDSDVAIDNSPANAGRIYVQGQEGAAGFAFDSAGNLLWKLAGEGIAFQNGCAAVFDASGHLWVSDRGSEEIREFDSTGSPPTQVNSFAYASGGFFPCSLDFDAGGNAYIASRETGVFKYVGGAFDSTLDANGSSGVAVDQSSAAGHIFTSHQESFNEYDSSGTLIGAFGAGVVSDGTGLAYSEALDRVYVANFSGPVVDVFGPEITGTVPDVSNEAASGLGVSSATFHGKVNPEGVANQYFFEWVASTSAQDWGAAQSSAPQALPEDSSEHAVSFAATGLHGNATYQVRLVGRNSANGLRSVSSPVTFTTSTPSPPTASIDEPSDVGATTATVTGTVNPQGDFGATWNVLVSTDPACQSEFSEQPLRKLESEAGSGVPVSEEITGLRPSQHYCVQIAATNGFGPTISETKEFETDAVAPNEVETGFAAPRLGTRARLNARVNPQGDTLKYRFEYSEDGGSSWIGLQSQEDTTEAREQVVVSEELTGLAPGTTYSYRFTAENSAGVASPQGEATAFTTRTTAETTLAPNAFGESEKRGIELVNSPDKGDQNAFGIGPFSQTQPISSDGNKAFWTITAGAPNANTGAGAAFLSERAAGGWASRSLVPKADKQIGGGEYLYRIENATPDFSHFVFLAAPSDAFLLPPVSVLRLDSSATQDPLHVYPDAHVSGGFGLGADLTDDGAHVLVRDLETEQVEDIGSGTLEVVSLMPGGSPSSCGVRAFTNADSVDEAPGLNWRPNYHRISQADASRVFFETKPDSDCASGREGLYVRNREADETTLIDPGTAANDSEVIRSTPDGHHVYFVTHSTCRKWSQSSTPPSCEVAEAADTNEDADVYRWDEGADASTCLTCEVSADANVGAGGNNEVLVSDDFSHIYFSSDRQLVPGRGQEGQGQTRPVNIYSLSGGGLHFVADPNPANADGVLDGAGKSLLSADGNVLVFQARASHRLTPDEVAAQCLTPNQEIKVLEPCEELYRYDDRDGSMECLSCAPGGLTTHTIGTTGLGIGRPNGFQLSADGSTIAFATQERLVSGDVNNDVDIYEWRNGAVRLLTDGISDFQEGSAAPFVEGIDASGANILFSVVEPGLTDFEHDSLANVYDARIGGGFEPPARPIHCSEESCQGPLQAAPLQAQPGSSTFSGRGNQRSRPPGRRCAKGKAQSHGRCSGKHPHKRHHKRAGHADKGGAK